MFELRYLINDHFKISKSYLHEGVQKHNTINLDHDWNNSNEGGVIESIEYSDDLDEFHNLASGPLQHVDQYFGTNRF